MPIDEKAINEIFVSEYNNYTFAYHNDTKSFRTLSSFRKFISNEVDFWKNFEQGTLRNIRDVYGRIYSELRQLQDNDCDEQKAKRIFNNIRNTATQSAFFIKSSSPIGQFISRLYTDSPHIAISAWQFLTGKNDFTISNQKVSFLGALNAFSFLKSLKIDNVELDLSFERLDKIAARHVEEIEKINDNFSFLENEYRNELDNEKQNLINCKAQFTKQLETQSSSFHEELNTWKDKFENLEKLYVENLRLKAPAEYWDLLKKEYYSKGRNWVFASIGVGTLFVILLWQIFNNFPYWLKGSITSDHLKGLIVFTLLASVFTYLLHLFTKLAISSYHLSRDAAERYQLTHVYLALLNEKAIEPTEREIILQALFSRADTGLIKNDGSPTMPGASSIVENILKFGSRR